MATMIKFTLLISLYFLSPQHTSSTSECSDNSINPLDLFLSFSCFQFNSWPELINLLNKTNFTDYTTILILTSQVLGEMRRKFDKGVDKSKILLRIRIHFFLKLLKRSRNADRVSSFHVFLPGSLN
jgi:hypothetical protein